VIKGVYILTRFKYTLKKQGVITRPGTRCDQNHMNHNRDLNHHMMLSNTCISKFDSRMYNIQYTVYACLIYVVYRLWLMVGYSSLIFNKCNVCINYAGYRLGDKYFDPMNLDKQRATGQFDLDFVFLCYFMRLTGFGTLERIRTDLNKQFLVRSIICLQRAFWGGCCSLAWGGFYQLFVSQIKQINKRPELVP